MTNLQIDSEKKHIKIELDLKGEPNLVEINFDYKLLEDATGLSFEIVKAGSSKEWLTVLLNEPTIQKKILEELKLSGFQAKIAKFCL